MCDDVRAFIVEMKKYGIVTSTVRGEAGGFLTPLILPGGGKPEIN
jgi:hypothetical protein